MIMMKEHKGEEMKGRIKKAAGEVTGDRGLKREGAVDETSARTKRTVEQTADKVKDAVNPRR
ncbi:CsbD family protein [bacterium]|nr:CsbD family protein [bacterium]